VTVSVYNADSYFLADATLLIYQDPILKKVTGEVTANTLGATPVPTEVENLGSYATNGSGSITVTDAQSYTISGYVNTSLGKVETTVESELSFKNAQTYTALTEAVEQNTTANRKSITSEGPLKYEAVDNLTFPFIYSFSEEVNPSGAGEETLAIRQKLTESISDTLLGYPIYQSELTDQVAPVDRLDFDAAGNLTNEPVDSNTETYTFTDSQGHCWNRTVSASDALVSAVSDGKGCPYGKNRW
jgi:hypothetical protein